MEMNGTKIKINGPRNKFYHRPNDDDSEVPLWPEGPERGKFCSWAKFLSFWNKEYPNLKVRKRGRNAELRVQNDDGDDDVELAVQNDDGDDNAELAE